MKSLNAVVVACSILSTLAYAQAPSQPGTNASSPLQNDQAPQSQKHHFFRDTPQTQKADTCAGPISFCTPYFGS